MITLAAALDGQMNGGRTVHDSHGKRPSGDAVGGVGERESTWRRPEGRCRRSVGASPVGPWMDMTGVLYDV